MPNYTARITTGAEITAGPSTGYIPARQWESVVPCKIVEPVKSEYQYLYGPNVSVATDLSHCVMEYILADMDIEQARGVQRTKFTTALGEIDTRGARATQDITARNAEIAIMNAQIADSGVSTEAVGQLLALRADLLAANVTDEGVLINLRQVAEENRVLMRGIDTAESLNELVQIIPWLPWKEA